MTKKIISWLSFMTVFLLTLQSCVHDEIYSSSDPASKEYHSKSIFKEDEKYIKNVMQVYFENEEKIKKGNGVPLWDYAMTMGNFDESFLIVPVVNGTPVLSCIQVPRKGDFISFQTDADPEHIRFFQAYITVKRKKAVKQKILDSTTKGLKECSFTAVSMWYPDSEQFPDGPGHWETNYITTCQNTDGGMSGGVCSGYYDANGNCISGYYYPGNGNGNGSSGAINPNQDIINNLQGYPCAQSIAQQLPTLKNDLALAMRQIFQNNENYNITFRPRSNMGNVDGVTFTSHGNTGGFTAIISLNDQVLAHATKEYILVTMYHEVIHAFLDYEKFRLGDTAFHDQYPGVIVGYDYTADGTVVNRYTYIEGHQQLIPFLTTLQNILSTYNPNLPNDVVVAMARTGITTTT